MAISEWYKLAVEENRLHSTGDQCQLCGLYGIGSDDDLNPDWVWGYLPETPPAGDYHSDCHKRLARQLKGQPVG